MFRHAEFFAENGITEHFFAGEASPAGSFKEEAEALLAGKFPLPHVMAVLLKAKCFCGFI